MKYMCSAIIRIYPKKTTESLHYGFIQFLRCLALRFASSFFSVSFNEFGVIPVLNLTAGEQNEDYIRHNEDTEDDPEDESPLAQGLVRSKLRDNIWCYNTGDGANSIDYRHQSAGVIGSKIQPIDFHSGVKSTYELKFGYINVYNDV